MRIVFLDIDGPMIPSTFILVDRAAGRERRFPATTIAVMNELCARSGTRIVLNTTHNRPRQDVPDIVDALVAHGIARKHFHDDAKTAYPGVGRGEAVGEWLAAHPDVEDWVAFDDAVFTQVDNLIWVDGDSGLTLCHLNQALERFGCPPIIILV